MGMIPVPMNPLPEDTKDELKQIIYNLRDRIRDLEFAVEDLEYQLTATNLLVDTLRK